MELSDDDFSQVDEDSQDDQEQQKNGVVQSGSKKNMSNVLNSFYSDLVLVLLHFLAYL
jgi:hypothetical protein